AEAAAGVYDPFYLFLHWKPCVNARRPRPIRDVAGMIQSTPTFVATIIGKADSVGSAEFNEHLSQQRGEAVFESLVYTNKVPENRVQLRWTGERLPFRSAADEAAESQN